MRNRGFTIMELLLVLMLVALLASLASPVVTKSIHRAKESTLKESLFVLRKAIDDYYADHGQYPEDLQNLVNERYIRKIPLDPLTETATDWKLVREGSSEGRIVDVKTSSQAKAADGTPYQTW